MKKFYRVIVYCIGLVILAFGIILNTKTGLGVAPVVSIPYCISKIWNINLGNATLCIYILCVVGQVIILRKKFRYFDLLQIPMSIVFSWLINIFNNMIQINFDNLIYNFLLVILAIMFTGIGVAVSVEMKIVPNAADGLAHAIGAGMNKSFGFGKNILDLSCVTITIIIGFVFTGEIVGIGIGTLIAVLGVGRFIALFNMLFKNKMQVLLD